MTEPTDAELEKLFVEETGFDIDDFPAAILDFARAVLQRWGQPSGAVQMPKSYQSSTLSERRPHGTGCRVAFHFGDTNEAEAWMTAVTSPPQPTQAQAGAVPLTDDQITAAAKKLAECMEYPWEFMPEPGRANMREHARAVIEAAHGIKAKEAGNAE